MFIYIFENFIKQNDILKTTSGTAKQRMNFEKLTVNDTSLTVTHAVTISLTNKKKK